MPLMICSNSVMETRVALMIETASIGRSPGCSSLPSKGSREAKSFSSSAVTKAAPILRRAMLRVRSIRFGFLRYIPTLGALYSDDSRKRTEERDPMLVRAEREKNDRRFVCQFQFGIWSFQFVFRICQLRSFTHPCGLPFRHHWNPYHIQPTEWLVPR